MMNWDGTQVSPTLTQNNAGGGMEHRQRSTARCDESKQRNMQNSELYGRSNEDTE